MGLGMGPGQTNSQGDVVALDSVVEHTGKADGEVASVPGVGKPDSSNDGKSEESAKIDKQNKSVVNRRGPAR